MAARGSTIRPTDTQQKQNNHSNLSHGNSQADVSRWDWLRSRPNLRLPHQGHRAVQTSRPAYRPPARRTPRRSVSGAQGHPDGKQQKNKKSRLAGCGVVKTGNPPQVLNPNQKEKETLTPPPGAVRAGRYLAACGLRAAGAAESGKAQDVREHGCNTDKIKTKINRRITHGVLDSGCAR